MAETGERIGAYEVVRLIARGGMATVYEAYQTALDRSVALKRLDLRSSDPNQAERFINESRLSASFNHPNIVTVFDFFEWEGVPYIAMEYLPRGSLRPWIKNLSDAQVFGVLEGMLKGLAHAQENGVAHRDLKPENVLITRTGAIKIADFGIAKAYFNAAVRLSATGMAMGTPTYMAPEQAMAQTVGPYTDLYAVGVMAYEMLSGDPPFTGGESPVSIMYKHVSEPPPPLTDAEPHVASWVSRLLEKAPSDRPPDAAEAWGELEPTVVDLLGPFWRNESTLGEIPKEEYLTVVGGEEVPIETTGDDPEPADVYETVAGGGVQTVEPEPEPEPGPEPEPEPVSPPPPEPVSPEPEAVVPEPESEPEPAPGPVSPQPEATVPPTRSVEPPEPADDGGSRRGLLIGAAVGVIVVIVAAIVLSGGGDNTPESPGGGAAGDVPPTAKAAAPFDFSGDGKSTPAIGMSNLGRVSVGSVALKPPASAVAKFGTAVASADFNSDGKADLAVGAPGANGVSVYSGRGNGLADTSSAELSGSPGFGTALAAGDLDGDRYGDLAVGAPGGDGKIQLFFGSSKGLESDSRDLEPPADAKRRFGSLLAVGDVNHDGRLDLVEAAPGKDGHVTYCPGAKGGPTECRDVTAGAGGPAALAVGDVTGDKLADIVQGFPDAGEPVADDPNFPQRPNDPSFKAPPGLVEIWRGAKDGPAAKPIVMTENTTGVGGNNQALDRFGASVALGDLDGDGKADYVIGAPGEDAERGRVTIVNGGSEGHGDTNVAGYGGAEQQREMPVTLTSGSHFGSAVQLLDIDDDGKLDLIGAAPGSGVVVILRGSKDRFVKEGSDAIELPAGVKDIALGASTP